jgi:hypothetical protein
VVHIITYDLHNPGRDYDDVIAVIKNRSNSWAHPQGSVWFVDSQLTPEQWVAALRAAGDSNDEYFVCRLAQNWWSANMDTNVLTRLQSTSRAW